MSGNHTEKYAQLEHECRYLLAAAPPRPDRDARTIRDRYLRGTRLRLREVTGASGVSRKLGHKIRLDGTGPGRIAHTSLYLDEAEFALLATLPADELTKTRTLLPATTLAGAESLVAIDVFSGRLAGLVLAELDLAELDLAELDAIGPSVLPFDPVVEVSSDERFTGGALAGTSSAQLARLLAEFGLPG